VCDDAYVAMITARSDVFSAMFEHEMEERKHVSGADFFEDLLLLMFADLFTYASQDIMVT